MVSAPDYCGWGAKQGSKVRTWKNRYFVLRGRELVYYSGAKSDGSGVGVGEKGRLKVLNVDYSPDRRNGLFIHGEGKDLKMTTASAQESRVLFKKIKEAIGEQDKSFRKSTERKSTPRNVEKEGWLLKEEPQLQTWKRRYVTLSGRTIAFCAEQNAVPIESQTLVQVLPDKSSPLSLRLVARGGREIHVAAETREEIEAWDRALAAAIGQPLALRQVTDVQEAGTQKTEPVGETELVARKYSTAVCEGWLEKLGQNSKVWKKRYMSLANGMLEYRKGPLEPLSAELYVTDVRHSVEHADALEIEFGSSKSLTDSDIICVRAESIRELDKWMNALCDAVGKPRLEPLDAASQPSSPSSSRSSDGRQSKPQLPPFPRNVLLSEDSDKSGASGTAANADRSSAEAPTTSNRIKRGWLYKQGDESSSWKLRYFVLNGKTLHHYKHVNATSEPLGTVASVVRNHESTGSLGVQFDDGSNLNVYGETKADTEAWYAALCKASWSSADNAVERVSASNQEDSEEPHEENGFQGWLLKKGQNFKTWKRRYFVLESSRLAYSASAGGEVLGSGAVFEVDVGDLRPFCLSIRFQNGRLLHVVAPTQEAFSKWLDVLGKASNLAESFLLQSNGKVLFDEQFDNDVGENANDADVEFTPEDIAEYELTLRDGNGASLWFAAMQNKPEYDALSATSSEQGEDEVEVEVADAARPSTGMVPRASDASLTVSQGCVGWLKKEGGNVKSWKRRYFTLYGSKLSYYKSEKGSLLRSVQVVDVVAHPTVSLGLVVSTVSGRKLIIQAGSAEEFGKWLGALRGAATEENDRESAVVEAPAMQTAMEKRPSEDLKATVSYSGWLQKEGQRFKTWKRRYFTLKNSALIYYSEIGGVARGHGMVKGGREDDSKPYTLVIEFRSGKTMRVTAASEAEMNSWYDVLTRGRSSSNRTTATSDVSDDIVDSEGEEDDAERAARISRFDSKDYLNDTINNDTLLRLRDEAGKSTMLESRNGAVHTSRSFKGELTFDDEEEKDEDMGLSTTGADYYRLLLAEDERVQQQRSEEKLAKGEPPIAGCAPCCTVM